ncbi:MAG: hypothetical protein KJO31_02625 [Gammaproteobacteria bacterium]|nr:hypothetical protein [Gammaproteobacteria bacterium]
MPVVAAEVLENPFNNCQERIVVLNSFARRAIDARRGKPSELVFTLKPKKQEKNGRGERI